jgi:hypothetical protein
MTIAPKANPLSDRAKRLRAIIRPYQCGFQKKYPAVKVHRWRITLTLAILGTYALKSSKFSGCSQNDRGGGKVTKHIVVCDDKSFGKG